MARGQAMRVALGCLAIGLGLFLLYWLGPDFPEPVETIPLGGNWEADQQLLSGAGHTGVKMTLYRRAGGGRVLVAENVWQPSYIGDDCVLFEAFDAPGSTWLAACGDGEPVEIVSHVMGLWQVTLSGLEHSVPAQEGRQVVERIGFEEIRQRAMEGE